MIATVMKPALVYIFLISFVPSVLGAAPSMTWMQCKEKNGELFSTDFHPFRCPEGQYIIGNISDTKCPCVCCSSAVQATEIYMYATPIVETRGGFRSVWGLKLTLSTPLAEPFDSESISIVDAKHSGELRSMMNFRLKQKGRELEIKFKPGMGDFGTGNSVHVSISSGVALSYGKWSTKDSQTDMRTDYLK